MKIIKKILSTVNRQMLTVPKAGFTFIELLIVFSFIAIISTYGISSFSSFNRSQVFSIGVSGVTNLLNVARSSAISQVKPSMCGANVLTGYKVTFAGGGQDYNLYAVCGGDQLITAKKLPGQLIFQTDSVASISFNVATGTVPAPGSLTLAGYGRGQVIDINKLGIVSVRTPTNL